MNGVELNKDKVFVACLSNAYNYIQMKCLFICMNASFYAMQSAFVRNSFACYHLFAIIYYIRYPISMHFTLFKYTFKYAF